MRRSRWYVALAAALVPAGLLAGSALAGPGQAVDRTSAAPLSVRERERANHRAAQRDAARLLRRVVLPPGAVSSAREPAGDQHWLARPGQVPAESKLVDRHRFWTIPIDETAAAAFVRTHPPKGSRLESQGVGDGRFHTDTLAFALPPVGRVLGTRWIVVALISLPGGGTGVRADAEVQWIVPRAAADWIPRTAHVMEVTVARPGSAPFTAVKGIARGAVRRIASLINGLELVQPAAINCPSRSAPPPVVTFTFRAVDGGPVLARASEPADAVEPTTPCDPMTLTVRARHRVLLLGGAAVVHAAQRLLGVRLSSAAR